MTTSRPTLAKPLLWILALLVLAAFVGLWIASVKTKARILSVLGPDSTVESMSLHWNGVTIKGLHGKAPKGWPVEQAFSAERVEIKPELRTLFDDTLVLREIVIEKPYVSVLRTREGKTEFLPGLIRHKPRDPNQPRKRTVEIASIVAHNGDLDWFDATVDQEKEPVRLQLDQVEAKLNDLVIPAKSRRSPFELNGLIKGEQRNGTLKLQGWIDVAKRDSSVKTQLRQADARVFEPYLIKRAEIGIKRGTMDFDLQSEVRDRHLTAPGRLVLSDLDLASTDGAVGTFMGVQRKAVVGFLKDGDGQIDIHFTLEGDLGATHFTLNEALSTRIALAAAEVVGLSVRGVVKGVGTLGQEGVNFVGDTLGKIFGSDDEDEEEKPKQK